VCHTRERTKEAELFVDKRGNKSLKNEIKIRNTLKKKNAKGEQKKNRGGNIKRSQLSF
jgi:hypothetical protein